MAAMFESLAQVKERLDQANDQIQILSAAKEKAAAVAAKAKAQAHKSKEHAMANYSSGLEVAGSGVTALGWGYINGRYGDESGAYQIGNMVAADLAAGVVATGLALAGFAGTGPLHRAAYSFGAGGLASFAARKGLELGAKAKLHAGGGQGAARTAYSPPAQLPPAGVDLNAKYTPSQAVPVPAGR